jgi:hypothetical protein
MTAARACWIVALAACTSAAPPPPPAPDRIFYAPVYEVLVTPQVGQDTAIYIGTAPQFGVKSAVTGGPLIPATYTASLIGFSGFAALAGGGIQLTNNITGAGVTGTMLSIGTAPDPVTFTTH